MNRVRLVFCRRHAIGSVVLRALLWSQWSHVAIVDGDDVIEAAAFTGVRVRPLADLVAHSSQTQIIEIPARDPATVIAAARSQIGRPYDWRGVIGIGARRKWQSERAWFCSELVAWAFEQARDPLFRVKVWRVTPRDIFMPTYTRP